MKQAWKPSRSTVACVILSVATIVTPAEPAHAAEAGDVVQANNVGLPLYTYNFDKGTGTSIGDKLFLAHLWELTTSSRAPSGLE